MKARTLLIALLLVFPFGIARADIVTDAGGGAGVGISVASGDSITVVMSYVPGMSRGRLPLTALDST